MGNTLNHAKRELDILVKSNTNTDNRPIIEPFIPEILAIVEKFGNSGQSGGSAPHTASAIASAIKDLCLHNPICPVMGVDEEWNDVSSFGENKEGVKTFQNNRCGSVFKTDLNNPYYLDAITWKTQTGSTWSGNAYRKDDTPVRSRQFIKSFPFKPKTFVIDVIEEEVAKDDWKFTIKDESQLKEVFEYYTEF